MPTKWTSSNKKIAAVSNKEGENGLMTVKKNGKVKITASFGSGKTANRVTLTVTVKFPQFKKNSYTGKRGRTLNLGITDAKGLKAPDGADIVYSIADKDADKAEIDPETGILTAADQKAGKGITVTATVNGIDYSTKVKIK